MVRLFVRQQHPILAGLEGQWPDLLGYDQIVSKTDATTIVTVGDDLLIVAGSFGKGRAVAFASDCVPHWAPPAFVEWSGYDKLWGQIADWSAGAI